ncbi:response regulator [Georgenia subflava]|uniref:Response regulator n=1 Tax=Georgenia subflava TaxID=1622177 RepID=A0A6N7EPK1_9MICO|nr:response regulator [Georgenia subflava]MPV38076.1 response regulator [Georgenia subflava]
MKVLVADDSRVMRRIVARTLRQAGYDGWQVIEAGDGAEALALAHQEAPDLVLTDWNMPEMSGLDLVRALRASGSTVPVGFVTSEGSNQMRALAEEAGAQFLIAKPFTPETFRESLEPHL